MYSYSQGLDFETLRKSKKSNLEIGSGSKTASSVSSPNRLELERQPNKSFSITDLKHVNRTLLSSGQSQEFHLASEAPCDEARAGCSLEDELEVELETNLREV